MIEEEEEEGEDGVFGGTFGKLGVHGVDDGVEGESEESDDVREGMRIEGGRRDGSLLNVMGVCSLLLIMGDVGSLERRGDCGGVCSLLLLLLLLSSSLILVSSVIIIVGASDESAGASCISSFGVITPFISSLLLSVAWFSNSLSCSSFLISGDERMVSSEREGIEVGIAFSFCCWSFDCIAVS